MSVYIGIRHEDKYKMERRAPLTPKHIERLIRQKKLDFVVQSSPKRIFTDEEFKTAGAKISHDLKKCSIILGVKEMPESFFEEGKTYVFFSHVIKGQAYNMPMLKKMMELKCNLIDYERIIDEQNRRLIFFGRYAGLAGMINSLWAAGQRLKYLGIDTPLKEIKQAHHYSSLADAKEAVSIAGQHFAEKGIPKELQPFTIGFTGYGNVSQGAQEILNLLPNKEISPEKLLQLRKRKNLPDNIVYKVVFREEHLSKPVDSAKDFDLDDYYHNPQNYVNDFEQYLPHLSILMNCMYWDARYPRILTKAWLKDAFKTKPPKLFLVGDITCDPDGSVEITHKGTEIEDPIFVYHPKTDSYTMGFKGEGLLDMAVDILPSELPRDASKGFADALENFIKPIAIADYMADYEDIDLPRAIKKALILLRGELTPDYTYLEQHLKG